MENVKDCLSLSQNNLVPVTTSLRTERHDHSETFAVKQLSIPLL